MREIVIWFKNGDIVLETKDIGNIIEYVEQTYGRPPAGITFFEPPILARALFRAYVEKKRYIALKIGNGFYAVYSIAQILKSGKMIKVDDFCLAYSKERLLDIYKDSVVFDESFFRYGGGYGLSAGCSRSMVG